MTAALLAIGDELLLGRTVNGNLAHIGRKLAELGLPLAECRTVHDDAKDIARALTELTARHAVVLTTGGLGPTTDDITRQTIADFFGCTLQHDEHTWRRVEQRFARRNLTPTPINRSQALVPAGFSALDNDLGTAPGLYYHHGDKHFFALPGVPVEMAFLIDAHVAPILSRLKGLAPVWSRTMHTTGIPESALATRLADVETPEGVHLAWLPGRGRVTLRVWGSNHPACDALFNDLRARLGDDVWGVDDDTPATLLHALLTERKLTLAAAESCTGGLVTARLTELPGSSNYLNGGVTVYSNSVKQSVLRISQHMLDSHGAVSEPVARAMAENVRRLMNADIGLGVTGIAGPAGGTEDKPVGTVYIAVATENETRCELLRLSGDRDRIRSLSAERVMLLAMRAVDNR